MDISAFERTCRCSNEYKGYTSYTIENISKTASEKRKIEKKKGICSRDDDWFQTMV